MFLMGWPTEITLLPVTLLFSWLHLCQKQATYAHSKVYPIQIDVQFQKGRE